MPFQQPPSALCSDGDWPPETRTPLPAGAAVRAATICSRRQTGACCAHTKLPCGDASRLSDRLRMGTTDSALFRIFGQTAYQKCRAPTSFQERFASLCCRSFGAQASASPQPPPCRSVGEEADAVTPSGHTCQPFSCRRVMMLFGTVSSMPALRRIPLLATAAVVGCAVLPPEGPSVMALPGSRQTFQQFRLDDGDCRAYASHSIAPRTAAAAAVESGVTSAAIGTAVGAVAGAAMGGSRGAAAGAGVGLLAGSASGVSASRESSYTLQRRYDQHYIQCMYGRGHKVPLTGRVSWTENSVPQPRSALPPPPPPPQGAPPPPPR